MSCLCHMRYSHEKCVESHDIHPIDREHQTLFWQCFIEFLFHGWQIWRRRTDSSYLKLATISKFLTAIWPANVFITAKKKSEWHIALKNWRRWWKNCPTRIDNGGRDSKISSRRIDTCSWWNIQRMNWNRGRHFCWPTSKVGHLSSWPIRTQKEPTLAGCRYGTYCLTLGRWLEIHRLIFNRHIRRFFCDVYK